MSTTSLVTVKALIKKIIALFSFAWTLGGGLFRETSCLERCLQIRAQLISFQLELITAELQQAEVKVYDAD